MRIEFDHRGLIILLEVPQLDHAIDITHHEQAFSQVDDPDHLELSQIWDLVFGGHGRREHSWIGGVEHTLFVLFIELLGLLVDRLQQLFGPGEREE